MNASFLYWWFNRITTLIYHIFVYWHQILIIKFNGHTLNSKWLVLIFCQALESDCFHIQFMLVYTKEDLAPLQHLRQRIFWQQLMPVNNKKTQKYPNKKKNILKHIHALFLFIYMLFCSKCSFPNVASSRTSQFMFPKYLIES